ncbi:MAG TPA: hypothetical protein VJ816_03165 [Gemmatimonadales bacterium]|nr:hypothetical protein [Gemmatimonadales bacterium]
MATPPPPPPPDPPPPPPPPPPVVAEPHLVGTPGGAVDGRVWVEGAALHYIASTGAEYATTGTAVGTATEAGRFYIAGPAVEYIDASGIKRRLPLTSLGSAAPSAVEGRMWIDSGAAAGKQLQWIYGGVRYQFWNGI